MDNDRLFHLLITVITLIIFSIGSAIMGIDIKLMLLIAILAYVMDTNFCTRKNKSKNT